MVLAFMALVFLAIVAAAAACFLLLPLIPAIVAVVIGVPLLTWLAVLLYGLRRKAQPLRPFDAAARKNGMQPAGAAKGVTS